MTARDGARHTLTLPAPAASFLDAFLLGNGRLGAAVHGLAGTERIDLNSDTFWSGGPTAPENDAEADPGRWLAPLRAAIRAGDYAAADDAALHLQSRRWTESYQPIGAVYWHYASEEGMAEHYRRTLHLDTGVADVEYGSTHERVTLTVQVVGVPGVVALEARGPVHAGALRFTSPHAVSAADLHVPESAQTVRTWAGRAPAIALPDYLGDVAEAVVYAEDKPDADGTVAKGMGFAVAVLQDRAPDGGVRLLLAVEDGFRGAGNRPSADLPALRDRAARRVLDAARTIEHDRETALERRREFFSRVDLRLEDDGGRPADGLAGPTDVERFFDLGRHLLIASSAPGTQPANLQGIWNEDVRPGWSCNFTVNINLPMNYWPAAPLGLVEAATPLLALVETLAGTGAHTAATFYGAPGWCVHHNTDVWGFSAPVRSNAVAGSVWANWATGGLWLTAHLFDSAGRLPEGPARAEIEARLLPLLDGAARFVLNMLEAGDDGALVVSPSTSPEHRFLDADGQPRALSAGVTMDQELARQTLENAVTWLDGDVQVHSRSALERLRRPRVGPDGRLLEWAHDWQPAEPGHRHVSHLYGLYPGHSIDEVWTPELYEAARRSLQARLDNGGGYTGWSQAWVLCLAARLRDPALVQHSLDVLVHRLTSSALLDLHPVDNDPSGYRFQIDGNFGATAGIVEALVSSRPGRVMLLQAKPQAWRAGRLHGIRIHGGHVVDVDWRGGELTAARIIGGGTGEVEIALPAGPVLSASELVDGDSRPIELERTTAPTGRTAVRWHVTQGAELRLTRA